MDKVVVPIAAEADILAARRRGRDIARAVGFGLADQTRLATAISELARNVLQHAGSGACEIVTESNHQQQLVRVVIEDNGPGIADLEWAMADGATSGGGLGAGLPAAKRLVHRFAIESTPGHTRIVLEMARHR